jgi:hypothetical protein
MTDTSAHEAHRAQLEIEALGFDTSDVCMVPDCYCDGTPHGTASEPCPPSAVVDQIVRWQDVHEGDLVLDGQRLSLVQAKGDAGIMGLLSVLLHSEGQTRTVMVDPHYYAAVRRYMAG